MAGWKDTAGQLEQHERAAAREVLKAAEKVYSASQKLAPRTSGRTVAALEVGSWGLGSLSMTGMC